MATTTNTQEARIQAKIAEIKQNYGGAIVALLNETNERRLHGTGKITAAPAIDRTNLRWTLAWMEKEKVSFDLNVVVAVEDDGKQASIGRVFVQRHA